MKRIAVLLVIAIFCSLLPMQAAALTEQTDAPDYEILQQGLEYALQHGYQQMETVENGKEAPASRAPQEDNLVAPGALMDGLAAKKDLGIQLHLICYQTGKTNQYHVAMIYKGASAAGKPLETFIGAFGTKAGLFALKGYWDAANASLGTHTLVTCTAELRGSNYEVVDGTASAINFSVVNYVSYPTSIYLADETGKRVDKICSDGTDYTYLYVRHEPEIVTAIDIDSAFCSTTAASVENYSGLIVLTPESYGWGTLTIKDSGFDLIADTEVEICINANGHRPEKTELCTAAEDRAGATFYYCPDCFTSKIVETSAFSSIFYLFVDVPEEAWFYDYVRSAVCRGLFNGVSKRHFRPENTMTRAMLVTVLWRYAGSPAAGKNDFTDVPPGQWYTDAVAWAAEHKIVDGVGNRRFAPDDTVTREQMAAILYRYASSVGISTEKRAETDGFADRSAVSAWASEPMRWCIAEGIIGGMQKNEGLCLVPQGNATRAEVSTILMRFIKLVETEPLVLPDLSEAEDYGVYENEYYGRIEWAFSPDGTLTLWGDAKVPAQDPEGSVAVPWTKYQGRVTTLRLLDGINSVGKYAFYKYQKLETVEFADSIIAIWDKAFCGCKKLKNIRWPGKSFGITDNAFSDCISLTELSFPESTSSIGIEAFSGCTGLKKVGFANGLSYLDSAAFSGCSSLEEVSLPDSLYSHHSVNFQSSEIFSGCTSLKKVRLPLALQDLPTGIFRNCTSLSEIELPKGMSRIHGEAFDGCESLKTLVLPPNIYAIIDGVFHGEHDGSGYHDTCGLTDLYILNPMLTVVHRWSTAAGPIMLFPFGNPERVTVHAFSGTEAEQWARTLNYKFVPLEEEFK